MKASAGGLRILAPLNLYALGMALVFTAERLLGEGHDLRMPVAALGGALLLGSVVVALARARGLGEPGLGRRQAAAFALGVASVGLYAAAQGGGPITGEDARIVARVLWPILWLVGTLPAALMALSLSQAGPGAQLEARRVLDSGRSGVALALAVSWIVALNYVGDARDHRFDFRTVKEVTPSEATVEMVRNLQEPVTVTLFFPAADEVGEVVAPYFAALQEVSPQLSLDRLDRDMYPGRARDMRVRKNGTVVVSRGEVKETLTLDTDPSRARRKLQDLDKDFQEKLTKVTREQRVVYILSGHGERSFRPRAEDDSPGLKDLRKVMEALNYKVKKLGLADGLADAVPEDATLVIVPGPTSPMIAAEQASLIRYVERGGAMMLLLDPDVEADPELGPLLKVLGVEADLTPLANDSKFVRLTRGLEDRAVLFTNRFMAHDSTRTLAKLSTKVALILPRTGSLSRAPQEEGGAQAKVTVRSLSGTWADADGDLENGAGEEKKVFDLVIASELPAPEPGRTGGRAIVTADVDMIADEVLRLNAGNQQWLVDAVRWLEDEIALSGEVSAVEDVPLLHTREEDKALFYATVVAFPLILFGLGGVMWRRRRRGGEGR